MQIPGAMQAVPEPPLEIVVKNAHMQVRRINGQQIILRFLVPGAGIAIGVPLDDAGREALISQLRTADLVISPALPT